MVELKDFVRESLVQIVEGVREAQGEAVKSDGQINPVDLSIKIGSGATVSYSRDGRIAQLCEFDVAVSATEGSSAEAKIGVFSAIVGAGAKGQIGEQAQTLSRTKFTVPLLLPPGPSADR